jgi:hypothetical protein
MNGNEQQGELWIDPCLVIGQNHSIASPDDTSILVQFAAKSRVRQVDYQSEADSRCMTEPPTIGLIGIAAPRILMWRRWRSRRVKVQAPVDV